MIEQGPGVAIPPTSYGTGQSPVYDVVQSGLSRVQLDVLLAQAQLALTIAIAIAIDQANQEEAIAVTPLVGTPVQQPKTAPDLH
jgi:hypothetical protein